MSGSWTSSEPQGWGATGGTAGTQTILTLPRVQQWQIAGHGSRQAGSVSLTSTNTFTQSRTHRHTHVHVFPSFPSLFSYLNEEQSTRQNGACQVCMCTVHVFPCAHRNTVCTQASISDKEAHTRLDAEPLLC